MPGWKLIVSDEVSGTYRSLTELPSARFRIRLEQFVDDSIEVHQPCILAQIILGLPKEHIYLAVATLNGELARPSQGSHNVNVVMEL